MQMQKRSAALMLLLCLAAGTMAGCGKDSGNPSNDAEGSGTEESLSSEVTDSTAEEETKEKTPVWLVKVLHYYEDGYLDSEKEYDADGNVTMESRNDVRYYYDADGNIIKQVQYGSGSVTNEDGEGEREILRWEEYEYWENGSQKKRAEYHTYKEVYEYDSDGNMIYDTYGWPKFSYVYCKEGILSETEEYDSNGNVIKTVGYNEDGNKSASTEYEYAGGNKIKESHYTYYTVNEENEQVYQGEAILESWTELGYNAAGNVTEETRYGQDGASEGRIEYLYDANGHLTERRDYDENGSEVARMEYTCDAAGNVTEEIGYLYGEISLHMESEYDAGGNKTKEIHHDIYGSGDGWSAEYEYDERGNLIKEASYYGGDTASEVSEYAYDEAGNQVETKGWYEGAFHFWRKYEYDAEGRTIRSAELDQNGNETDCTEYEYDAYGCVTRIVIDGTELKMEEEKDEQGNITKRTFFDNTDIIEWYEFVYSEK